MGLNNCGEEEVKEEVEEGKEHEMEEVGGDIQEEEEKMPYTWERSYLY